MTTSPGDPDPGIAAAVNTQVLEDQVAAINERDATRFAAFYSEDAVVRDPQYPEPLVGRAAVANDSKIFFTAFPDLRAEVTCMVASGATLAAEMTIEGTHTGPLTLPSGEVPPTGRLLKFAMAFFARIDNQGLIVDERRYYDVADQLEQLGLGT
ncbi:ester cyclase [Jiangella gansuensis]|uniref:ester cyclase n=1 Tax=Jiangella gansuensis TaxID=281473 RepID=UPI0004BA0573|nr:ester cyclase [Jiangella gansuensis]